MWFNDLQGGTGFVGITERLEIHTGRELDRSFSRTAKLGCHSSATQGWSRLSFIPAISLPSISLQNHWLSNEDPLIWVSTWTTWILWDDWTKESTVLSLCLFSSRQFLESRILSHFWEVEITGLGTRKYLKNIFLDLSMPVSLGRKTKSFPLLGHRFNYHPRESWPKDLAAVLNIQSAIIWLLICMKARLDYRDAPLWLTNLSMII